MSSQTLSWVHAKILMSAVLKCLLSCAAGPLQRHMKDPEDEDEEDLSALMKRLRAAKPPAEVLKVAAA